MAVPIPSATRAALFIAVGAGLLGLGPILVRLSELGPQATALWRFAVALPLLTALAVARRRRARGAARPSPAAYGGLALAGICFGLDIALWHWSLTLTSVANATLLSNMTPILAAAGAWILLRERPGRAFFVGAAVGLIGAALLSYARSRAAPGAAIGDLIAFGAAVWYAAYLMILRVLRRDVDVVDAMAVTTFAALCVALLTAIAAGEALAPRTLLGWGTVICLGVVVHVGGQGLITLGLGSLPLSVSTILLWVQPVAAAALGWALFDEALGPTALLGAALLLLGVWVVQRGRDGADQAPATRP